ncbi:hypothetical protein GCM10022254_62780 [Actinomadura meridiana]|uniref:Secreted protein n=1 Tax=Actinomadura meridiana TaxID=559626 RepID=A0ABP8CJN3_9ACTN
MNLRRSHRLAAVMGAAVVVTAMTGTGIASARTTDTLCGPEVELGSVVYKTCSDALSSPTTQYGTQQFIEALNRGFGPTDITVTLQHWDAATSAWVTDATGARTLAPGASTRYFNGPNFWPCGQDAQERTRAENTVGVGDWSEVTSPAPC